MTERPRRILDLSREQWTAMLHDLGQPTYRVDQLLAWIHVRGVLDPAEMTNLPRTLRDSLRRQLSHAPAYELSLVETSDDGTTKLGLRLVDGAVTETVLIPEEAGDERDDNGDDDDESDAPSVPAADAGRTRRHTASAKPRPTTPSTVRYTQCLSTQVGCAFGCAFCRSGTLGFVRHLDASEILAQRHAARRTLAGRGEIVRTVLMGIGEPLHNVAEVVRAVRLLVDPRAGAVSPRRITVSTIGLPEGIRALGEAFGGRLGLAWSLHAADEAARRVLLPVAARRPVDEVVAALRDYPLPPRRRITVECVLVGGVNDSDVHARGIVRLLSSLRCKVNLIPFNPWAGAADSAAGERLRPPAPGRVEAFREILAGAGLSAFVRRPRGADILAACGQLLGAADLSGGERWDR